MKSVNRGAVPEDDEDEEEEYMEDNNNKKDGSSQKGDSVLKEDGKNNDQKANVTRSKHSVSEQRRRCKINERFQILRDLVPHSDEKRDKASFLLEVIEYIEFLQEKVQKYEPPNHGWYPDRIKLMTWKKNQGAEENTTTKNGGFIISGKFDDNNTIVNPALVANSHNQLETDNTGIVAPHPNFLSKAICVPVPCVPTPSSSLAELQENLISDAENMTTQPLLPLQQKAWPADHLIQSNAPNEQEGPTVEGGTISISSIYSQRLLCTLTNALQSSGLDISQANISVQIDVGKSGTSKPFTTTPSSKDYKDPSCSLVDDLHAAIIGGDLEQAQKRPRTEG